MPCALQIDDDLILALKSELHVRRSFSGGLAAEAYVVVEATVTAGAGPLLQLIDEFCTRLSLACESREKNQQYVVILPGNTDDTAITTASMLLGSFLILHRGHSVDAVLAAFQDLSHRFVPLTCPSNPDDAHIVTLHDCWRALGRALLLGWFVPPASDDEPALDAAELAHYARPANGGVRILAPGALLLFPTPSDDLPAGQEWADAVAADGRAARRFGAGFCASLLADLGATSAACLGRASPAAARALAARGVAPLDLHLAAPAPRAGGGAPAPAAAAAGGLLLRALDRLLTLARAAPGAVAVHCGAGGGAEWPAAWLATLAAAFLISRFGFSGPEAAAWVHLAAASPQ
jgi:hypothetical protein